MGRGELHSYRTLADAECRKGEADREKKRERKRDFQEEQTQVYEEQTAQREVNF